MVFTSLMNYSVVNSEVTDQGNPFTTSSFVHWSWFLLELLRWQQSSTSNSQQNTNDDQIINILTVGIGFSTSSTTVNAELFLKVGNCSSNFAGDAEDSLKTDNTNQLSP